MSRLTPVARRHAEVRTGGRGLKPLEHPADRHGDGFLGRMGES